MWDSAMHFKYRVFLVFAVLQLFAGEVYSQPERNNRNAAVAANSAANETADTFTRKKAWLRHPFVDSLLTDSLFRELKKPFLIKPSQEILPKKFDPYDPFIHKAYYRIGQGKFWFFIISLLVLGLFIYYRLGFPKQFSLRFNSLFSQYYFQELISDLSLTFTSGSLLAMGVSMLVMSQLAVLVVIYSRLVYLNNVLFFILVVFLISGWKIILYLGQLLYAGVLQTGGVLRNMMQRQVSFDFWFAIIIFPVLNLVYYNSGKLQGYPVSDLLIGTALSWIVSRMIFQMVGLIREKSFSFNSILYFCALEILPHIVIVAALLRVR